MSYTKKVLKLYYTDHSSSENKEYHVVVEAATGGYHVYGLNGPRGRARTKQNKTAGGPVTLSAAEAIYDNLVEAKRKKGYTTDVSGTPFSGVWGHLADITGVAPASAPAKPVTTLSPLKPTAWFNTAGPTDFDQFMVNDDYVAQELPTGIRVLVEVTSDVRLLDVITGASWSLPLAVQAELKTTLSGWIVDGTYDTVTSRFAIVDGYVSNPGGTAVDLLRPFASRFANLIAKVKTAKVKHLEIMEPHAEEEKHELVCALQGHGRPHVLLRKQDDPYKLNATDRDEGSVVLHTF